MTTDFSKYKTIIDDFKGQVLNSDFEARYTLLTKKIPKTERFLLKMELKRLAASCTRLIDLRGHVDGECRPFEQDERIHYLDDIAIKVFQESVAEYGGYTFGVYEAAMNTENNFRVIYQKEKTQLNNPIESKVTKPKIFEKTQYPAELYNFGPYFNRSEERMNYAISIQVFLNEKHSIEATSSDISTDGCKFRFSKAENIKVRQMVTIKFVGLENDFQFGTDSNFTYEIRNIQTFEDMQLVGVCRVYTVDERRDGFKHFLKGFIQGNKRRYKINLDNSIKALQSRSFEQFLLPKLNELPIFIEDKHGVEQPRYALTCHNNQNVVQYWQDENRQSTLNCLVTQERLIRLKKAKKLSKSLIVYSFIHNSQGKSYFYSADDIQLLEDEDFRTQFLAFAADKTSFAITQLSLLTLDPELANSPLTLANTLTKKDQYLNLPLSDDVNHTLSKLSSIVVAHEINDNMIKAFYQELSFENINTTKLKRFGHKRSANKSVDNVGINYNNQRQEPRFKYKTPLVTIANKVQWRGYSIDFSASGLKVEFEQTVQLKKGDIVDVSFPALQKITSAFDLKELPYEVMRVNKAKTVVNFRVHVEQHQHIGRAFFKALIQKNKDKLTLDEHTMLSPGLAKALRNIYSGSLTIPSLVIQTSGSRYKIEAITTNHDNAKILSYCKQLSDREKHYNLYPLLNNMQATSLMHSTLKKMQPDDEPINDVLYISINFDNEMVDHAVTTKLGTELQSETLRKMFISKALKRGKFICLQVKLSRTGAPDMAYLNPELSYISSYAIHRGKQIEQDIWSVAGVVQLFDITQETLIRHHISTAIT